MCWHSKQTHQALQGCNLNQSAEASLHRAGRVNFFTAHTVEADGNGQWPAPLPVFVSASVIKFEPRHGAGAILFCLHEHSALKAKRNNIIYIKLHAKLFADGFSYCLQRLESLRTDGSCVSYLHAHTLHQLCALCQELFLCFFVFLHPLHLGKILPSPSLP